MTDDKSGTETAIAAIRLAWGSCEGDKALVEVVEAILERTVADVPINDNQAARMLFDAAGRVGAVWSVTR